MSEDFEAVCEEFGVQRAFVLGWSLGGRTGVSLTSFAKTLIINILAAHLADIVTHATSVKIAGLINVQGPPYIDATIISRVAKPETMVLLGTLAQPPSVDAFQETVLKFIRSCSSVMSQDLYRKLLEGVLLQPRSVTAKLITRKQDPEKFLQEAREGKLDALVVRGGKDALVNSEELEAVYQDLGWKKYRLIHLDDGDHLPWVSSSEEFCTAVLGWVKERQM